MINIPEFYKKYLAKPDESLYEHTKNLLVQLDKLYSYYAKLPYFDLVANACLYHDIGKMNPIFSDRMKKGKQFDESKEIGHNILSFYLFCYHIDRPEFDFEDFNAVAYAVLNHHFYVNNFEVISDANKSKLIDDNLSLILNSEDGDNFKRKKTGRILSEIRQKQNFMDKKYIFVKGILHKCDYSASAHSEIEYGDYDLTERLKRLNYTWNDMQNFAADNKDNNIIIIGSTGLGKTEASLLWIGNNKGFYVLPLKTAINTMYFRIKDSLYDEKDYMNKLALLHGDTQNIYLSQISDKDKYKKEVDEENKFWEYYEISRNMSLPLIITTPDQLFKFVFKYPGFEMQLATYSYSKIVIDEIQAYNSRLLAFLIYGIQRIAEMGGKIAIITATLAPFIKDLMRKDFDENLNEREFDFNFKEGEYINPKVRHKMKVLNEEINFSDIINFYNNEKDRESLKILVVMNTVKDAQNIYGKLKDISTPDIEVKLLHAKYILKDRNKKEKEILEDGKRSIKKHVIWISTQIVEASLDIDFDYLFTEYAELNSLFQRMGRCNRAGSKELDIPNVYVYTQIKESYLKGDFIDETLYNLGKKALNDWFEKSDGYISEVDKLNMINSYYTTENIKKSRYMKKYKENYRDISYIEPNTLTKEEAERLFRDIFSVKVIPESIMQENKEYIDTLKEKINKNKNLIRELNKKIKALKESNENIIESEKEKNKLKLEIMESSNEIRQFTLNIGYFKGINKAEEMKIGGEKILKVKGNYSYDTGFSPEDTGYYDSVFI